MRVETVNALWLLAFLPLAGSIVAGALHLTIVRARRGARSEAGLASWAGGIACGAVAGSFVLSIACFLRLLRAHDVRAIMAGDTHDLEYYREPVPRDEGSALVHHWVNGGGGAYLSFGTALAWPNQPARRPVTRTRA